MLKVKALAVIHLSDPQRQQGFLKVHRSAFFIDASSGFTANEQEMISMGIRDWNGQQNNSGVSYIVTVTSNPPAVGGNNTIIVTYNDNYSSTAVAALSMHQTGSQA